MFSKLFIFRNHRFTQIYKRNSKRTFAGCSNLKNLNIPDYVTNIEEEAFLECTSLESITIPYNTYGNVQCFNGCSIKKDAFKWCNSLKEINIPFLIIYIMWDPEYNFSLNDVFKNIYHSPSGINLTIYIMYKENDKDYFDYGAPTNSLQKKLKEFWKKY